MSNLETLSELKSNLREKCDILEDELGKLKVDQVSWDVERSRLQRELEVKDEKLSDLAKKLGFCNESETNAIKRYDRAMEYSREVEAKMEAIKREIEVKKGQFVGKLSVLKDELMEKEVELGDLRGKNEELESENEDLLDRIGVLENEIVEVVNNKDGQIEELRKEKDSLKREKEEVMAMHKMIVDRVLKLKADVASHLCSEAKRDVEFGSSQIEKTPSLIEDALDGEQGNGAIVKKEVEVGGNLDAEPAFVSQVNVAKCEETVKTTKLSSAEVVGENGAACDPKSHSPEYIQISDSDDDDEISCHVIGIKRERASSVCSIQKHGGDSSSDGSLNPKRKIKKLESVFGEVTKHGRPIIDLDCRSDNTSSALRKQAAATIRKCEEILSTNVNAPGLEGYDRKDISKSNQTNILVYMEKRQQNLKKDVVADEADMVLACQKDPEFCTKAVCALFRNDLLSSGQKECKKRDIDSSITMTSLRQMDIGSVNEDKIVEDEPLPTSQTQTPRSRPRPRESIYLSHQPGGVWWDDPRIVNLLGCSFTSTYETYVTNWTDCPPAQRDADAMFNYFQEGVRTDKGYDLRKAYEARIKRRMTSTIYDVASTAKRPTWMPVACFERLLTRKDDPKFQTKAEKAKANRLTGGKDGKALPTHVLGRQSAARAFRKMGPSATPYQLFEASKKKGGKWINPRSEEVDAVYQIKKAQFDAGEITADEFHLYIESAGGFNRNNQVFGLGGVARELFTPS